MSAVYCDGFDTYSTIAERWTHIGTGAAPDIVTIAPRTGPSHLRMTSTTSNKYIRRSLGVGAHNTITVQLALYRVASGSGAAFGVQLYSTSLVAQTGIRVLDTGAIEARRGDLDAASTLLGTSSGVTVPFGAWAHIAFRTSLADTGAPFQIWINSNLVLNLTNQDTRQSGTDTLYEAIGLMSPTPSGVSNYVDDLVILNGAGSVNNTFIGDVQVLPRLVSGAGDRTQLTPYGNATNWQNVNEVKHDGINYNGSATPGNADLYTMQDVPAASTINFVQQTTYAGKNEAGVKNMAPIVKSGGTEYPQAAVGVPVGFFGGPLLNIYENDPATSAPWTGADFNAAQLGAEVRA
jgi:hypothetical protein